MKALMLLAAFVAGAAVDGAIRRNARDSQLISLQTENMLLAQQAGASCEPVYAAWWGRHECDGVVGGFLQKTPLSVLCPVRGSVYRAAALEDVRLRVQKAGPGTEVQIFRENGVREAPIDLKWLAEVKEAK